MDVQDHDCCNCGQNNQDHRKENELDNQGHHQTGWWRDLEDQEEEHRQRDENGNAKRDLFATVSRQIKDQGGQNRD